MAKLGFLGLGIMGYPMAGTWSAPVTKSRCGPTPARRRSELASEGNGTVCASPREVAEQADYIFYCVGDTAMSARSGHR